MPKRFINKDHAAGDDQKYAKDSWGKNDGSVSKTLPKGVLIGSSVGMTSQHSAFNKSALISNIFFKNLADRKMVSALASQGYTMIGQLKGMSQTALIRLNGVGKASANKILGVMADV